MSSCILLPGVFGILIQVFLAFISITVILLKYVFERPRRKLSVFFQDLIQLICGSSCVHILNMVSSILINKYTHSAAHHDECNLYFIATLFDATLGIYLEYKIARTIAIHKTATEYLKLTRKSTFTPKCYEIDRARTLASNAIKRNFQLINFWNPNHNDYELDNNSFDSKYYRDDTSETDPLLGSESTNTNTLSTILDKSTDKAFQDDLYTWLIVVSVAKSITLFILIIFSRTLNDFAAWLLTYFDSSDKFKLVFVMIGAPLFLNVLQYYLTDCILKVKHITPSDLSSLDKI